MPGTPKEQHLRNQVGQLTHRVQSLLEQRREMQADLIRQREDMSAALAALNAGSVREAFEVLSEALAYRERTRPQRRA